MTRRERMKISASEPALISVGRLPTYASMSPKKLYWLDSVGDGNGRLHGEKGNVQCSAYTPGVTMASVVYAKDVSPCARKQGALVTGRSGKIVTEKVPSESPSRCRLKNNPTPSPTAHHIWGAKIHHYHRQSPLLRNAEFEPAPPQTPRPSPPFSRGISFTPQHPGAISAGAHTSPSTPRARGSESTIRHRSSISRSVEDDSTFCHDQNVQVIIRSRPVNRAEIKQQGKFARHCVRQENVRTISWLGKPEARFTFDHVAGEFVTQEELFEVAGMPMVDNCMAGYNSCMFAYGQTGSGKTHTMLGNVEDSEDRGMTPRAFQYLFAMIRKEEEAQKHGKLKYTCRCSFLEIYNEQISDLLEPTSSSSSSSSSSASLQIREDKKDGVFVEGLLKVDVQSVEDVLRLLLLGMTNRKVAATNRNKISSRSHSVFTCVIKMQWECDSMINVRFGRLHLVDLAGSERQKDHAGADGLRLREAASINKSLSTLGHVIKVLVDIADGKQRHVPYRDSKLTFLLQDSLGGNSKTTIIANISPSSCASSETLSTLKFAQRAKFIQNKAVINENLSPGDVKGMQEEIKQLKDELARIRKRTSVLPSAHRKNLDIVENTHLQARLFPRCLTYLDAFQERKATVQDMIISVDDAIALPQQEASVAGLIAAERQKVEGAQNEVQTHQKGLSECQIKLRTSLESNERISRELDAVWLELQNSQEECRKCKQELATLQVKEKRELSCMEFKEAPQQQIVVLELKTLLQTANLVLIVDQLQAELTPSRAMLKDERSRRAELEDQINAINCDDKSSQSFAYNLVPSLSGCSKHIDRTRSANGCFHAKEKRKIKHQEAIIQLQMELASLEGCALDATIQGWEWEEDPPASPTEAEQRCVIGAEAANLELCNHLDAARDLQHQFQINSKEEEIVKLKEQATGGKADCVTLEESDLVQVACVLKPEERQCEKKDFDPEISASSEQNYWINVDFARNICTVYKIVVLHSTCEVYPESGKTRAQRITRTSQVLQTGDTQRIDLKFLSEMVANLIQTTRSADGQWGEIIILQELEIHRTELTTYKKKAERYQAKSSKLKSQVQALKQELARVQPLPKEIVNLVDMEELHVDMPAQESCEWQGTLVEDLERSQGQLQEEVKRKQCAIEAVEEHLLKSEQSKLQCQLELHLCEQEAEFYKTRAEEKEDEVVILKKSVEELESTVYALESQVGLLKREGERQCLVRLDLEMELQGLKQQGAQRNLLKEREDSVGLQLLRKSLEKYQIGYEKSNIASLSQPKPDTDISQMCKKNPKGSMGSAFKWFKMNRQVHSELNNEERTAYESRIQEIEAAFRNGQNEITALKEKLADAERVTRAVTRRILHSDKADMANVATRTVEKLQERDAHMERNNPTVQKDDEVERMLTQINNIIEEKESWLAVMKKKQAELAATQLALEKLQGREMALVAENKKFKIENRMLVKKMGRAQQETFSHQAKLKESQEQSNEVPRSSIQAFLPDLLRKGGFPPHFRRCVSVPTHMQLHKFPQD